MLINIFKILEHLKKNTHYIKAAGAPAHGQAAVAGAIASGRQQTSSRSHGHNLHGGADGRLGRVEMVAARPVTAEQPKRARVR
jgi:hypothetical protein